MCQYKSAIVVLKTGGFDLLHHANVDSHEDLVAIFGLNDTPTKSGGPRFARVEYCPPDGSPLEALADIETYRLIVDEPRRPDWFSDEMFEQVEKRLRGICAACILKKDTAVLAGGPWIVPKGIRVGRVLQHAVVLVNFGTVTTNSGTVKTNDGTVTDNYGTVTDNYGTVTTNFGTVKTNYGTVTTNTGTVKTNDGTVKTNYGTVTTNDGTVKTNDGTVKTNYNTVTTNSGTVKTNDGTVKTNYGTVTKQVS